jgi:putative tryptophan/tyrosine transport system substrate-binding protein
LVGLKPDAVVVSGTPVPAVAREASTTIPIGVDVIDVFRRTAVYVDRILRGEKPGDLPIQQPTKFELIVNPKTAKALGLAISDQFLLLADEVIE